MASVPASAMLPLYCAMHGAIIIAPWCDVSRRWVWVISGQSDGHHSNGHSCAGSLGVMCVVNYAIHTVLRQHFAQECGRQKLYNLER